MYRPRRPTASPLFRLLTDHFDSFRGRYEDNFEREHGRWRRVVEAVVARYLECGVLEAGFARVRCEVDPLVCPKCGGTMRVIALIQEPKVIDKILRHLRDKGRDARAGPWATGPPAGTAAERAACGPRMARGRQQTAARYELAAVPQARSGRTGWVNAGLEA